MNRIKFFALNSCRRIRLSIWRLQGQQLRSLSKSESRPIAPTVTMTTPPITAFPTATTVRNGLAKARSLVLVRGFMGPDDFQGKVDNSFDPHHG